jgi:hypothetical protein
MPSITRAILIAARNTSQLSRAWPGWQPRPPSKAPPLHVHAPLINLGKAQIIQLGAELGVDYALTVSCYQADSAGAPAGSVIRVGCGEPVLPPPRWPDPTRYAA